MHTITTSLTCQPATSIEPGTTHISDLPLEILLQILFPIPPLSTTMQVCRQWRVLGQAVLKKTIVRPSPVWAPGRKKERACIHMNCLRLLEINGICIPKIFEQYAYHQDLPGIFNYLLPSLTLMNDPNALSERIERVRLNNALIVLESSAYDLKQLPPPVLGVRQTIYRYLHQSLPPSLSTEQTDSFEKQIKNLSNQEWATDPARKLYDASLLFLKTQENRWKGEKPYYSPMNLWEHSHRAALVLLPPKEFVDMLSELAPEFEDMMDLSFQRIRPPPYPGQRYPLEAPPPRKSRVYGKGPPPSFLTGYTSEDELNETQAT